MRVLKQNKGQYSVSSPLCGSLRRSIGNPLAINFLARQFESNKETEFLTVQFWGWILRSHPPNMAKHSGSSQLLVRLIWQVNNLFESQEGSKQLATGSDRRRHRVYIVMPGLGRLRQRNNTNQHLHEWDLIGVGDDGKVSQYINDWVNKQQSNLIKPVQTLAIKWDWDNFYGFPIPVDGDTM